MLFHPKQGASTSAGPVWVIDTPEEEYELLCVLEGLPGPFGLDVETVDINPSEESPVGKGTVVCWSLAWTDSRDGTNARGGPLARRAFLWASSLRTFGPWLARPDVHKVGHSLWAFDRHVLANAGVVVEGILCDTLRLSRLLNASSEADHSLKGRMRALFGYGCGEFKELFSRRISLGEEDLGEAQYRKRTVDGRKLNSLVGGASSRVGAGTCLLDLRTIKDEYPEKAAKLYDYASLDAKGTLELYYELRKHAESTRWVSLGGCDYGTVWDFYEQIWNPFLELLWEIERAGIGYDDGRMEAGRLLADASCTRLLGEVRAWTGNPEFNPASPPQLTKWLYEDLGYPIPPVEGTEVSNLKKVKAGKRPTSRMSTAWLKANGFGSNGLDTLQQWKREARQLQFLEKLPNHVRCGRIHSVLQPEAETGRLTSKNPNLQQIPKRHDPYGIRGGFVPGPGNLFVVADFSQLELVVLAHFLIELFDDHTLANDLATGDAHTATAERLRLPRDIAKNINYGISYGKSAMGLGLSLGISTASAQTYLDAHDAAYPGIKRFQQYCFDMARSTGVVRTLAGRTRPLPRARSEARWEQQSAYRQAANTPIQGSAADIVVSSMLKVHKRLSGLPPERSGRMVLQVHDEIIVECRSAGSDEVLGLVVDCMEHPFKRDLLRVPLHVVAKIAPSWMEGK